MKIHDISPRVHPGLGVWPGDTPFRREVLLSLAQGANLELSTLHATVHLGAHTDAPSHYQSGGASIEARPLELYLGPCEVRSVAVGGGQRIPPLDRPPRAPRVLLRTGTFPDPDAWNNNFAALSVPLVHQLAEHGVVLVGLDTPSVDLFADAALEAHHAIAARDLAILEGVVLDRVADGLYTLVALPLPLAGCDASPVRAVLVEGWGS